MLYNVILGLFVVNSVALVALILIQHGKGAEAGAAFGSGASGTVFGSRGSASFLTRTTGVLATLFFALSLTLAYLSNQQVEPTSVLEKVQQQEATVSEEVPPADIPVVEKEPAAPTSDVPASE